MIRYTANMTINAANARNPVDDENVRDNIVIISISGVAQKSSSELTLTVSPLGGELRDTV